MELDMNTITEIKLGHFLKLMVVAMCSAIKIEEQMPALSHENQIKIFNEYSKFILNCYMLEKDNLNANK